MDDLRTLMIQFASISGAEIGREPNEPPENVPFAADVKSILENDFPQLSWDEGYIDFLSHYGGAIIWNGPSCLILDIDGPSGVSGNVSWDDISTDFDEGFFPLCFLRASNQDRFDFSLNLSSSRKRGIYASNFDADHNTVIKWYCDRFLDLLINIVQRKDYFSEIPVT